MADMQYDAPEVADHGTLAELTLANQILGQEDAGAKISILDVSDGMLP